MFADFHRTNPHFSMTGNVGKLLFLFKIIVIFYRVMSHECLDPRIARLR